MTEQLIKLITENKSLSEICEITKQSRKQLFIKLSMLRQCGYLIDKQYNYNGEINYSLSNPFKQNDDKLFIKADDDIKSIRMILTSDSHYGNIKESLECTDKMFDYCVKENINLIFHLGDFFEGVLPSRHKMQKYNSTQEQIQETLSNYPLVPNILTITCLGNHDASFWLDAGIDIKTILENRRHDIVPVAYGKGNVNIKGYDIIMEHEIERIGKTDFTNDKGIILIGHSHKFNLTTQSNGCKINVHIPSSSNINQYNNNPYMNIAIPSIIDAEFILHKTQPVINQGIFKQYILLNNQLVLVGEQSLYLHMKPENIEIDDLTINRPRFYTCFDIIEKKKEEKIVEEQQSGEEHEENIDKPKTMVLTKCINKYQGMNQIEKFNMRYGQ